MSYRGLYIYNFSLQYLLSGNVFTDMYLHTIPVIFFSNSATDFCKNCTTIIWLEYCRHCEKHKTIKKWHVEKNKMLVFRKLI